ncbi:hypothetical protein CXQ85_004134 [Candidozyma haemuli]|uniref:Cation efflux protein transmembrane domain-containing protein n=1 Tax=Candidozyma haemuli TaxID=45357 RepID=A0A2V1B0I2_9ASCO|nr:hypothetical protein CXQ85_004134 [[Candida] haemuloni]PVH23840.1 hypothetical protein CXQ85_004134 [[Candida] haemuloni]
MAPRKDAQSKVSEKPGEHTHSHGSKPETAAHEHGHGHEHEHEHSHDHDHGGVFHSHSHSQPNELLGKGFTTNPAVRITWIGLLVNVAMAGSKAVGGVVFHSQALIADAIHSLSDMVADFLTLATVNVASKEGTTTKFPMGYGKIEAVGTFLVSGVLLAAGISVGWTSLLQILEYTIPASAFEWVASVPIHGHSHGVLEGGGEGHSHSHVSGEPQLPNINAAWLALGSIGVKEVLYRKTMAVADQTNSKVLVANAWHHRVDSLTAGVAFVTVMGGVLFDLAWLDAVGGGLVSILIIHAGWGSFKEAWYELVDRSDPPASEHYQQIRQIVENEVASAAQNVDQRFTVKDLSVLSAGARFNLILHLTSDSNVPLQEIIDFERELLDGIRQSNRYVGKVFVEYDLK